jgi:hypothetical protein
MSRRVIASAVMVPAMLAGAVVQAGSAGAADEWIMPDVRGEVLAAAIDDVREATGGADVKFTLRPSTNQEVYNYSNWAVCVTAPRRESEISQKSKSVVLVLRRLNEKC